MPGRAGVEREARRIIADDYAGRSVADEAIRWASEALEAGYDGPNVRMLAASTRPANWFETEPYFRRALAEVGVPRPGPEEAMWHAVRDTAAAIIDGEMDPERGVWKIAALADALDYPGELMELYLLDDDLAHRYGPDAVTPERWRAAACAAAERLLYPPPGPVTFDAAASSRSRTAMAVLLLLLLLTFLVRLLG